MKAKKTINQFAPINNGLTKQEQLSVNGGDTWRQTYADGRVVFYSDEGSVTYYPDGTVRAIFYNNRVVTYK